MARRILIADDHVAVRHGIKGLLEMELPGFDFGFASTQPEVTGMISSGLWDVVLLDLSMPGRGGLESVRELKDLSPSTSILIYTAHPEDQLGVRALRAGADGFITKDRPPEELVKAVRRVLEGKRYISDTLAERMAEALAQPVPDEPHELLSDREYQILRMMGSGKSASEIAVQLNLSVKTVSTYRTRVLQKLNLQTTAELIRYAVENRIS
jgi:two-component system, NarL family, invasion response regulator UvrY